MNQEVELNKILEQLKMVREFLNRLGSRELYEISTLDEITELELEAKKIMNLLREKSKVLEEFPLSVLDLTSRAETALKNADIRTITDLCYYVKKDPEFKKVKNIGPKIKKEIFDKLQQFQKKQ